MTLEKVKALLHEFGLPLVNQLNTYQIALTEKLNVLGAQDDKILALMTEERIKDEIKETGNFRIYSSDDIEAQALQALEINSESYGKLLIPSLVEKITSKYAVDNFKGHGSTIMGLGCFT
ncbi:hypothetical protein pdam_00006021 [Pocillopora damicornis]|uniref:Uncharacterized protein n=1 Tax=Pocillopora damicornis TaxID=46731 RepID=A0A3M6TT30_POCDA|nr:hypothetical protein pdam_00006021 [Pocillopora damicornis]